MKCDTPQTQKPQPPRGSALLFLDHSSPTNAKLTWRLSKRAPYLWRVCVLWCCLCAVFVCVVMCWVCVDSLSQVTVCMGVPSACGYVYLFPTWNYVMCTYNPPSGHNQTFWFLKNPPCVISDEKILCFISMHLKIEYHHYHKIYSAHITFLVIT